MCLLIYIISQNIWLQRVFLYVNIITQTDGVYNYNFLSTAWWSKITFKHTTCSYEIFTSFLKLTQIHKKITILYNLPHSLQITVCHDKRNSEVSPKQQTMHFFHLIKWDVFLSATEHLQNASELNLLSLKPMGMMHSDKKAMSVL